MTKNIIAVIPNSERTTDLDMKRILKLMEDLCKVVEVKLDSGFSVELIKDGNDLLSKDENEKCNHVFNVVDMFDPDEKVINLHGRVRLPNDLMIKCAICGKSFELFKHERYLPNTRSYDNEVIMHND